MAVVNRIVVLASDLSGEEGAEAFTFDLGLTLRDIAKRFPAIKLDLLPAEADEIDEALGEIADEFETAAREILAELYAKVAEMRAAGAQTSGGAASKTGGASAGKLDPVRVWARENGYEIGDRGRIKAEIKEAFDAAHAYENATANTIASWDNSVAGDGDVVTTDGEPTDAELAALEAEATV